LIVMIYVIDDRDVNQATTGQLLLGCFSRVRVVFSK
jgi:hypothetical protein